MYQAQLAACGAKEHAIGGGVQTYAIGNKRWYPAPRPGVYTPGTICTWQSGADMDSRPMLRPYIPINKLLLCPLTAAVDLESTRVDAAGRKPIVEAPYLLWFNFQYALATGPERTMKKLGDDFTYLGDSFKLLAMDWDLIAITGDRTLSSHPDRDGVLTQYVLDNTIWGDPAGAAITQGNTYAMTRWENTRKRGALDLNYLYDDGSVRRANGVVVRPEDQNMAFPPMDKTASQPYVWQLPVNR